MRYRRLRAASPACLLCAAHPGVIKGNLIDLKKWLEQPFVDPVPFSVPDRAKGL